VYYVKSKNGSICNCNCTCFSCGHATLFLTPREEHKLWVCESRVLKSIIGLERGDVMEGWRKLSNKNLDTSLFLSDFLRMIKARRIKWVIYSRGRRSAYKIL
jgi:hypothetical protein